MILQKYEKKLYFCKMAQKNITSQKGSLLHRLMGRTPMLRLVLAMVTGILLSEYLSVPFVVWLCVAVVPCMLLLVLAACGRQPFRKGLFTGMLWVMWIGIGALSSVLHTPADPFPERGEGSGVEEFYVRLCDSPRTTPKCYKAVADVLTANGHATAGKVLLYIRQDSVAAQLRYGDYLVVATCPEHPRNWDTVNHFDYRRYLQRKGILWQCYVPSDRWQLVAHDSTFTLRGWSKAIQLRMVERLRCNDLTPAQQGIAEALLLGWRDNLDDVTRQLFRDAGIMHLLCVSGLHVGIVAWLVGTLLFFLGMRRWQRVVKGVVQIGVIWFFVLLTGMAPSTLRAGVMFSLLLLASMLQRQPNSFNNLCTSMLLLLMVNPMLLFDVGFQLSYAAVAGIIAWSRPLRWLLPRLAEPQPRWYLWLPQKVWQLICLSTSAQIATLPLMLYHFHQFPLYFLIANITIVPFAGVLLATVLLVLLTGSGWVVALLRGELVAVDVLTRWIASLPHAMLTDIYCDLPTALILTALILVLTMLLYSRRATV